MTLAQADVRKEYIVKDIKADDEELLAFWRDNFDTLNEYNDSFFENKSLIIVPLITPSGGDRYKIKSYKINGSEIILNVKATSKGITCDLGEWFMILEINSNKVENIDKVSLNVNK